MISATLVTGANAVVREAGIARAIDPALATVVLLEGLATGRAELEALAGRAQLQLIRIAPGCPCCSGNLTLRVTLNRILRRPPAQLYISLASSLHLEKIRQFLSAPPYDARLQLNQELQT
jgi:hypothetical protein